MARASLRCAASDPSGHRARNWLATASRSDKTPRRVFKVFSALRAVGPSGSSRDHDTGVMLDWSIKWVNVRAMSALEEFLAIRRAVALWETRVDAELGAAHGLGLSDFAALHHLFEAPGARLRRVDL